MDFKKIVLLFLTFPLFHTARSQESNPITTAVPFASYILDAQSVGVGLIGVVASDLNTQNGLDQNPALLSRGKKVRGLRILNYLQQKPDKLAANNFYELGYYQSIGNNNAIGLSARYMDHTDFDITNQYGDFLTTIEPREFMVALKYAHNFSDYFSMGAGIRYIYSDITNHVLFGNLETYPGQSIAGELGFDYRRFLYEGEKYKLKWNAGLSIINLGSKVKYSDGAGNGDFIPQEMKFGTLFTSIWNLDSSNYIAWDIAYQADKLLVPTPPIYGFDSNGDYGITDGMDPDVSVMKGAVQSFYDAPGGAEEELHEIIHHIGTEARVVFFDNKILTALRWGYFQKHETKGNVNFQTLGFGIGHSGFRLDFAYFTPNDKDNSWVISIGARLNLDKDQAFKFIEK